MSRSILIILCVAAMESVSHANKNFIPDWTFTGSSLADADELGAAKWTAQNGEVIGTPSSPDGGWLLFTNPRAGRADGNVLPVCRRLSGRCVAAVREDRGWIQGRVRVDLRNARRVRGDARRARARPDEGAARAWRRHGPRARTSTAPGGAPTRRARAVPGAVVLDVAPAVPDAAARLSDRRTRDPTMYSGRANGTRWNPFSTRTFFARGSTMDRKPAWRVDASTTRLHGTAAWDCTSAERRKCDTARLKRRISRAVSVRTSKSAPRSGCSA